MLLVGNGLVITRNDNQPIITNGCIAIDDNIILELGPTRAMRDKYRAAEFIDAGGKIIMPGLINTHMHLYSTFARGMVLKDEPPGNFLEMLECLWWRLDKVLTGEDIYYSALVPLIDCIKNGTTTIFDHHASPGFVRESLCTISQTTKLAGVRSCLCYEVSDRDGPDVSEQGIRENFEFVKHCRNFDDEMVKGMFGLHASFTLSDKTLARCSEFAHELGTGCHVHMAEGREDLEDCRSRYGKQVVERFRDFGLLGPKTIAAHCVHINHGDIKQLQQTNTKVVHNPQSNMGNAVGCAPVIELFRQGVTVGLGTDGYTADMFESLKAATVLHKHQSGDPNAGWAEVPAMLFANNSAICAEHFSRPLGMLVPGAYADVLIVDYNPPTPLKAENVNGHIIYGLSGGRVDTTLINGRVVMRDRKLLYIDEAEVSSKSRELAAKAWKRF